MRSLSMVHTLGMQSLWRRVGQGILLAVLASGASGDSAQADRAMPGRPSEKESWQKAASLAAGLTPDARVLVLEIDSGRLLAARHLAEASETLATPGSTLKPLILYFALASGQWNPDHRVACLRNMHIGNHQLNCSHPAADPMDAVQALTWSCNSYFAELAGSLTPEELHRALSERELLAFTGLVPQESAAEFRLPRTREQVQLAALGVEGIRVTLPELAEAYRSLEIELKAHRDEKAAQVVQEGLSDSASYGMAGQASLGGVPIAGKTGTASPEGGGASHGWFVGFAPADSPRVVVAVYVPRGHGSDAAGVAARVLALSPLRQP
jgi:cell division protein FtsI/penicillin-binding protein 2